MSVKKHEHLYIHIYVHTHTFIHIDMQVWCMNACVYACKGKLERPHMLTCMLRSPCALVSALGLREHMDFSFLTSRRLDQQPRTLVMSMQSVIAEAPLVRRSSPPRLLLVSLPRHVLKAMEVLSLPALTSTLQSCVFALVV